MNYNTARSKFEVVKEKVVMINYLYQNYNYALEFLRETAEEKK